MSFRAKREISPHCRTRDFSQESKWQRRGLNDRGKNLDSRLLLSRMTEKINRPRLNKPFSRIQNVEMSLLCRLRARRSRSTESTFRRRLFERSEFLSHLDSVRRRRHPGDPASERVGGTAHGQKWFWFLLPKQKGLVARGETPHKFFSTTPKKNICHFDP